MLLRLFQGAPSRYWANEKYVQSIFCFCRPVTMWLFQIIKYINQSVINRYIIHFMCGLTIQYILKLIILHWIAVLEYCTVDKETGWRQKNKQKNAAEEWRGLQRWVKFSSLMSHKPLIIYYWVTETEVFKSPVELRKEE